MNPTPELSLSAASTIDFIVVVLCAAIGMGLKSLPWIKNDFIPLILMTIGAVFFSLLAKSTDPLIIKAGLTAGLTAVGGHQLLTRSIEGLKTSPKKDEKPET